MKNLIRTLAFTASAATLAFTASAQVYQTGEVDLGGYEENDGWEIPADELYDPYQATPGGYGPQGPQGPGGYSQQQSPLAPVSAAQQLPANQLKAYIDGGLQAIAISAGPNQQMVSCVTSQGPAAQQAIRSAQGAQPAAMVIYMTAMQNCGGGYGAPSGAPTGNAGRIYGPQDAARIIGASAKPDERGMFAFGVAEMNAAAAASSGAMPFAGCLIQAGHQFADPNGVALSQIAARPQGPVAADLTMAMMMQCQSSMPQQPGYGPQGPQSSQGQGGYQPQPNPRW